MRIIYIITQEEAEKISEVRKTSKDKSTDKRLYQLNCVEEERIIKKLLKSYV